MPRRGLLLVLVAATLVTLTSCQFFDQKGTLTSISVTPVSPVVPKTAGTQQFTATGVNDDGSQTKLSSVTWTSGTTSVATIDANSGLATILAAGTSTITATSGSLTGSTTMTVTAAALSSIKVTAANNATTVTAGTTLQLTATGTFADNTTMDITSSVQWSTSDSLTATVITPPGTPAGQVTGVKANVNAVTITATSGTTFGTIQLTVQ